MPACRDCPFYHAPGNVCLEYDQREYKPGDPMTRPLARGCVHAIAKTRLPLMTGRVLEIGPGATKLPRRVLDAAGKTVWHGIDPQYRRPTGNAYRATVGKIPLPDEFFDHVFGFETIEHWQEYGESVPMALKEIARVLVPGGSLLLSAPIHQHGADECVRGDLPAIRAWFDDKLWNEVRFEPWRKDFLPLPVSDEWRYWGGGKYREQVLAGSEQEMPSSWALEIRAWKRVISI